MYVPLISGPPFAVAVIDPLFDPKQSTPTISVKSIPIGFCTESVRKVSSSHWLLSVIVTSYVPSVTPLSTCDILPSSQRYSKGEVPSIWTIPITPLGTPGHVGSVKLPSIVIGDATASMTVSNAVQLPVASVAVT